MSIFFQKIENAENLLTTFNVPAWKIGVNKQLQDKLKESNKAERDIASLETRALNSRLQLLLRQQKGTTDKSDKNDKKNVTATAPVKPMIQPEKRNIPATVEKPRARTPQRNTSHEHPGRKFSPRPPLLPAPDRSRGPPPPHAGIRNPGPGYHSKSENNYRSGPPPPQPGPQRHMQGHRPMHDNPAPSFNEGNMRQQESRPLLDTPRHANNERFNQQDNTQGPIMKQQDHHSYPDNDRWGNRHNQREEENQWGQSNMEDDTRYIAFCIKSLRTHYQSYCLKHF